MKIDAKTRRRILRAKIRRLEKIARQKDQRRRAAIADASSLGWIGTAAAPTVSAADPIRPISSWLECLSPLPAPADGSR